MSDRPSLRSAYVAELGSAVRGAGPARATAVVLALALVGLLAGRRLAQGPLVGSGAFDVTVQVLRELLPILVMPAAGLRYAIRRQQGVDQAQHLAGVQPAARLAVVGADATLLLGSAEIAAVAAVAVGAGGLTAQPLRDLGTLLVGTLWCVGVLASVSALAARVAGSAAGFLAVGLGAPIVGSLLGWAGWVYPVLDRLAQVWPWRAATAFLQVGSAGQWWVSAGASVVTLAATIGGLVAAAADRTGARVGRLSPRNTQREHARRVGRRGGSWPRRPAPRWCGESPDRPPCRLSCPGTCARSGWPMRRDTSRARTSPQRGYAPYRPGTSRPPTGWASPRLGGWPGHSRRGCRHRTRGRR